MLSIFLFAASAAPSPFHGTAALENTKRAVAFGERPSGSAAIEKLRAMIVAGLKHDGGETQMDSFQGQTPSGPIRMANVIQKFPGTSGKSIVVTGHYDTKRIPMMTFLGANDGGSSTGFLLELARSLALLQHHDDIYIVFLDGEEAVAEWSDTDSRYGSRHLAAKWLSAGLLPGIKALINIDMIGDRNLNINNDENSSPSLRAEVQKIAASQGLSRYFRTDRTGGIDDDHIPFIASGVNAIDLIDFDYGPRNAWWHQSSDTLDKLNAKSFQVVGDVVLALIHQLEAGVAN